MTKRYGIDINNCQYYSAEKRMCKLYGNYCNPKLVRCSFYVVELEKEIEKLKKQIEDEHLERAGIKTANKAMVNLIKDLRNELKAKE